MNRTNNRRCFAAVALITLLIVARPTASAQRAIDFDKVQIQITQIADGLYVLTGEGGNIAVLTGAEGVFLVDAQYAPLHGKIIEAIRQVTSGPIRYLVNTHHHADHTEGNDLMVKAGAMVIGHETERRRQEALVAAGQQSREGLPTITYSDHMTLHFNSEEIYIYHPAAAHTDGDSVVFFRNANAIHVGDLLSSIRYPRLDVENGSVDGSIAAANQLLELANAQTKIIPGHVGVSVSIKEVSQQRDMLATVRDRVLTSIRAGKSLEQTIAAKPTAEFDEARKGSLAPDEFVRLIYRTMERELKR